MSLRASAAPDRGIADIFSPDLVDEFALVSQINFGKLGTAEYTIIGRMLADESIFVACATALATLDFLPKTRGGRPVPIDLSQMAGLVR